jgi:hypothetical protein
MKGLRREFSPLGGHALIEDGLGDYMVVLAPCGGALLCTGGCSNPTRCKHVGFVRRLRRKRTA